MDMQAYWRGIRGIESSLPAGDQVYLTSVENREKQSVGGRTSPVGRKLAAKMIADKTHRLATDEEIAAWHVAEDASRAHHAELEYSRKQQFAMPKELEGFVRLAADIVAGSQDDAAKKRKPKGE